MQTCGQPAPGGEWQECSGWLHAHVHIEALRLQFQAPRPRLAPCLPSFRRALQVVTAPGGGEITLSLSSFLYFSSLPPLLSPLLPSLPFLSFSPSPLPLLVPPSLPPPVSQQECFSSLEVLRGVGRDPNPNSPKEPWALPSVHLHVPDTWEAPLGEGSTWEAAALPGHFWGSLPVWFPSIAPPLCLTCPGHTQLTLASTAAAWASS